MSLVLTTASNPGAASWQPLPASATSTVFAASRQSNTIFPGNTLLIVPLTTLSITVPASTFEYGDVIEYSWFGWFNDNAAQTAKPGVRVVSAASKDVQTVGTYTTSGAANDYLNVGWQSLAFKIINPAINPTTFLSTVSAQGDLSAPGANQPFVRWQTLFIDKDFALTITPTIQWSASAITNGFAGDNAFLRITRPT